MSCSVSGRDRSTGQLDARPAWLEDLGGKVFGPDDIVSRGHARPFHRIFQLADVARPPMLEQCFHRLRGDLLGRCTRPAELLDKVFGEEGDILGTLVQWRQIDFDHVEAVIEVFSELPFFGEPQQISVGCGDDADVDFDGLRPANSLEPPFLQHAQQLRLHGQRNLADLVEKDRSTVRQLEPALTLTDGAREGPLLVAKQLALQQSLGECRTIDGDKRSVTARRGFVDGPRHKFFAGTGLAEDQDRADRLGHVADQLEDIVHSRAFAQDVMKLELFVQLLA